MNRLPASLRLLPEALIDPTWPQFFLLLRREGISPESMAVAAKAAGLSMDRVCEALRDPSRIDRVSRMRQWSKR